MGGLGYMFDAMDAAVLAFILPVLRTTWNLSSVQIGVLGSSTYIGFLFGALLAGTLGDLIGRRAVMMSALASAKASRKPSTGEIIKWTSKGFAEWGRSAFTTAGPIVRLGTKWPSMTSM